MIDLGECHENYVPSSTLSKMIKQFYDESITYTPFLAEASNCQDINTDECFEKTMKQIYKSVEPFVVHIRSGNNNDMKTAMIKSLTTDHGFVHVDVEAAVRGEAERGTVIGQELSALIGSSQIPTNEIITRMLSKVLYCGKDGFDHFILSSYPGTNDQAEFFEKNCTSLSAIIYPTVGGEATV